MITRTREERFRLWKLITLEYNNGNVNLADICKKHNVTLESYYNWNEKYKGNKVVTIVGEATPKSLPEPVVIKPNTIDPFIKVEPIADDIRQHILKLKQLCPNLIIAARQDDVTVHLIAQGDCDELWDMQMCLKEKRNGSNKSKC